MLEAGKCVCVREALCTPCLHTCKTFLRSQVVSECTCVCVCVCVSAASSSSTLSSSVCGQCADVACGQICPAPTNFTALKSTVPPLYSPNKWAIKSVRCCPLFTHTFTLWILFRLSLYDRCSLQLAEEEKPRRNPTGQLSFKLHHC